ncbi:proteolipid protein DM gamma-like isoform X2 [Amphiura filiformis]|uniref:proteolipid protein DM gamma-like isoform X2 n=1 Tax=Amphiura filiformis TaxID=82378 RepID=UPI003B20C7F2
MSEHGEEEDGASASLSIGQTTDEELEREYMDYYDDYYNREGCCDCALCRCLRRVPYGTLFATFLVAGGLALLCYETLVVRDVFKDMFKDTALDPASSEPTIFTDGYEILFWVLIAVVCVMGLFAILLLVFACFSNGSSGRNTCGKHSARCVGRFSTSLMIIATYGVSLVWLVTVVGMSMAFTFMMMVRAYCKGSVPENPPDTQCLDLAQYGLVTREGAPTAASNTTICGDSLKNFCGQNEEIHLCVYLIMVACVVIVIGMIHFLMSLAANHTYLKVFQRSDPPRTKYGNDYRRTYTGNDYPGLQEPLNMSDETTRF